MNINTLPRARSYGIVVQEMPDEVLVYDLDTNKAHCLNSSSAIVWRACDGATTIAKVVEDIEKATGGKVSDEFVWLAIDQLNSKGLLESKIEPKFEGRSRREALKRIGMASVVALPVIASLVAPPNALAATSCNCSTTSNCTLQTGCQSRCDNRGSSATFRCVT